MDNILSDQYITSLIEEHIKMLYKNDKNKDLEDFYRRLDNCINYMKDRYPVKQIQKYALLPRVVYEFQKMHGLIFSIDKLIMSQRCINFVNIWKDTNTILENLMSYYNEDDYVHCDNCKFLRYSKSNKGIMIFFAMFNDSDNYIFTETKCVTVEEYILLSDNNSKIRDYILKKRCKEIKDDIELRKKNTNSKDLKKFFDKTLKTMENILSRYLISMNDLEDNYGNII